MTLADIVAVCHTVTRVNVWARDDDGRLLQRYWIGDIPEALPQGAIWDIGRGELTVVRADINHHGEPCRGGSEMGWGFRRGIIPESLMQAEITSLSMRCRDGVRHEVTVTMALPELTWQTVKDWGGEANEAD